ncbi:MAG: ATP synthase F1 subunit delta [Candidatus Latescibacteria bacterium]|jgi:F-type H+-transporting ATPase subunit delta|nr:ATP synthase F1 subunit delta [Candidatus Latescibacterota bacterium]
MIANKRVAKRYAKSFLYGDAVKKNIAALAEDTKALAGVFESDSSINEFFTSPLNTRDVKLKVIGNIAKKLEISSITLSLLKLLINKDRMEILTSLAEEFEEISDRINDRIRIKLTTAYEPSVSELEEIAEKLSQYFGKKAVVERSIDPGIVGGFKLEGEGKLIDMSIKGQIRKIISNL